MTGLPTEAQIMFAARSTGAPQPGSMLSPRPMAGGLVSETATMMGSTLTPWNGLRTFCAFDFGLSVLYH